MTLETLEAAVAEQEFYPQLFENALAVGILPLTL